MSGVNFGTTVLLARSMGPDGFGVFSLVWMLGLLLNSLRNALLTAPMMTLGPGQGRHRDADYIGSLLALQLFLAGGGALLLGAVIISTGFILGWPRGQAAGLALGLGAVVCAGQVQDFVRRVYFLTDNEARAFLNDLVSYGGQIAILLGLVAAGSVTPVRALLVVAATSGLAASLAFPWLRLAWSRRTALGAAARECVTFGKWIAGAAMLQWAAGSLLMYGAAWELGAQAVGALRAGQNVMGVVNVPMVGLENAVPRTAAEKLRLEGSSGLAAYVRRVALFGELALTPVAIAVLLFPEGIMGVIYGSRFRGDGWVLRWWAVTHMLFFLEQPFRAGLRALQHTRAVLGAYLAASTFALVAAMPLARLLGLRGITVGILVVNVITATYLGLALARRLSHRRTNGTASDERPGSQVAQQEENLMRAPELL